MDPQSLALLTTAIAAIATGFGFKELLLGAGGWFSGRNAREKARVQQALTDRDEAETERRILEEYATKCRLKLIELGVDIDHVLPWPINKEK